jgi:hypothetical protein
MLRLLGLVLLSAVCACWVTVANAAGTVAGTNETVRVYSGPGAGYACAYSTQSGTGGCNDIALAKDAWLLRQNTISPPANWNFTGYSYNTNCVVSGYPPGEGPGCSVSVLGIRTGDAGSPSQIGVIGIYAQLQAVCPPNATQSGGSCTCNDEFIPNGTATACVASSCDAGTNKAPEETVWELQSSGASLGACYGGCKVYGLMSAVRDGRSWLWGPLRATGEACSAVSTVASPPAEPSPESDQPGSCVGTVNGATVTVPCDSTTTTTTTQTSSTSTGASGAGGTSTTTTEITSTTCSDGRCTTTTTTTTSGSDGSSSGSSSTTSGAGSGSGSGSGTGTGEEDPCTTNPSGSGCGGTPAEVGSLYAPKEKTFGSVLASFRDGVASTPLGSGVGNFFTVSAGGSCPTWTFNIEYLDMSYEMDVWCLPWATTALSMMGAALMVVAGFFAFRTVME